jgi:hypothetical protein
VWGTGVHDVWGVSQGDPILHFTGQWSTLPSNAPNNQAAVLQSVWSPRAGDAWAAGFGSVQHFSGLSWAPFSLPITGYWWSIWGRAADDAWVVGNAAPMGDFGAKILHWDGTAWSVQFNGVAKHEAPLYGIGGFARNGGRQAGPASCADRQGVWAVGAGAVFAFDPTLSAPPTTCEQIGGSCTASCAAGQGHLTDYACGQSGTVCCVSIDACSGAQPEPTCCSPATGPVEPGVRPYCHDGVYYCPVGDICRPPI